MMFNVVLSGYGRSGKDTAADYLVMKYGREKRAFSDGVRGMALTIDAFFPEIGKTYSAILDEVGYDKAKDYQCVRDYLVRIGEGGRTHISRTVWMDRIMKDIKNGGLAVSDGRLLMKLI